MAAYDITVLDSVLNFETGDYNAGYIEKITDTKAIIVWQNSTTVKYVQCFSFNRTTGAIAGLSTKLNFYEDSIDWAGNGSPSSVVRINDTKFIVFWTGTGNDGFCRTFQINESTGQVTAWSSQLEYNTTQGDFASACLISIDATYAYILNVYQGADSDGFAQIFRVTLSDGSITQMETPLEFDGTLGYRLSVVKISNTQALVCFGGTDIDGFAIVLNINNTTWAVTANSATEWLNSGTIYQNSVDIISSNPLTAINAFENFTNFGIQPFSINTSTWAISTLGSSTSIYNAGTKATQKNSKRILLRIDASHFILFFTGTDTDGFVRTYSFNTSTGATSNLDEVEFNTSYAQYLSAVDMGDGLFINIWKNSSDSGYAQAFSVELPVTGPANLKSYNTNLKANIKSINGNPIANVKSLNTNV